MVLNPVLSDVLRDPDSNPLAFSPSDLPGLKLWARYKKGITVTGSGVSQWDDQSGNGNHLLQGVDTNRPALQDDGSILFDGIDNFLKAAAFTLVQPETIFILGKQITWTSGDRIFDGNALNSGGLFQTSATPQVAMFAGATVAHNPNWTLDTYDALAVLFNGASSSIKVGDSAATTGNAGAANMGGFTLGASGASGNHGNTQTKEVIICSSALDDVTIGKVIKYLQGL